MADTPELPPADGSQDSEPIDLPKSQASPPPETTVSVSNGRRRGRRKVMKKKMIKDEEGYLGMFPPTYIPYYRRLTEIPSAK